MAIHPIDLQTLYSQMERVGQQKGAEQQIDSTVKDAQNKQNRLETDNKLTSVQLIEEGEQYGFKVDKDNNKQSSNNNNNNKSNSSDIKNTSSDKVEETEDKDIFIKDPNLGKHIDISG